MKKLILPCLVIAVLAMLSACSTEEGLNRKQHTPISADDNPVEHPDNGPFATDPHSVFTD